MEEKKPQDPQVDEETIEETAEQAEPTEKEETEESVETESVQAEDEITETTEEFVEADLELEKVEEESVIEESIEEALDESEFVETDDEAIEEPFGEDTKEIPVKDVPKGLVLQPWQLAVAVVVVAVMIVGGVLLGVVLGNRNNANDFNGSPVDYDWVLPQGSVPNANQIILPGYGDLLFPAGEKQVEIILPNPKSNPCYFRYTLMLEATGEILYQSPLIAPGKAVLEIELSRALSQGDYHLVIAIDSVSLADGRTPMNGGEHRVLLQVR